jgi:hypothetical protein
VTNPDDGTGPGSGSIGNHTAVIAKGGNTRDPIVSRNGGPAVDLTCLNKLGYHWAVEYQPASRYWDFQRIETAMYLSFAVIPIGVTYWLVLRRDA